MVGDLGSQVENADTTRQNRYEGTTFAHENKNITHLAIQHVGTHDQLTSGISSAPSSETESHFRTPESHSTEESQASEGYIIKSSNGELVVGDRFWTIFCKEVR